MITIERKDNGFTIEYDNEITVVNTGKLKVERHSYVTRSAEEAEKIIEAFWKSLAYGTCVAVEERTKSWSEG